MRKIALAWMLAGYALAAGAADSGSDVVVVYNSRMPDSKGVAEYYAQRRSVPKDHVFGFSLPTKEDISRVEFRDSLQTPLGKALEEHHLWHVGSVIVPASTNRPRHVEWRVTQSKIRYLALCYGVPLRIAEAENIHEEGFDNVRPELKRNVAAVDSELALLPMSETKYPIGGPLRNWTYGATNADWLHPTNGILIVARLDGPNAAIARGLVDKALEAETNGLWGRAYFDIRNSPDPNMKQGDDWIRAASEICRHLGFETIVDTNAGTFPVDFPMSQIAIYMGWYTEHVLGPFTLPKVEFMPGAFAYHLHSFSANTLRSTNTYWVGPLLAKGATATMGCVAEPYLGGTPDVAVFAARFFFQGYSFGEAACACQPVLSWQTTVVGDPLYRPCGKDADLQHQQLVKQESKLAEWSWLRLLNFNLANGKSTAQVVSVLEGLPIRKKSSVLCEKLGDLYTEQGKPSSAVYAYKEALDLSPSPQQRIRITLELGDKLRELNKEDEAYDYYVALLKDSPDYPKKRDIVQRLLPLARKMNKNADVEKYEAELKNVSSVSK
jgi:uncharacterized protein (TIGR03790 family)